LGVLSPFWLSKNGLEPRVGCDREARNEQMVLPWVLPSDLGSASTARLFREDSRLGGATPEATLEPAHGRGKTPFAP